MPATVTIVNVGQGDCTVVVDSKTHRALLIDCNRGHHEQAIGALESLGFTELCAAVVTHSHDDHFGGVIDVLEELQERFTGVLYLNHDTLLAMPGTHANKTRVRALINRALQLELDQRISPANSDLRPQTLGTTTWTLLAPSYGQLLRAVEAGNPNMASGIVLIKSAGRHVIIGGDALIDTWKALESRLPKRSIVRWPHHGGHIASRGDAQRTLFQLLEPAGVLISVGANNPYSHPSQEFFNARAAHRCQLLCTQATAKCTGGEGEPCAGSIQVTLRRFRAPTLVSSTPNHDAFVRALAHAQCIEDISPEEPVQIADTAQTLKLIDGWRRRAAAFIRRGASS